MLAWLLSLLTAAPSSPPPALAWPVACAPGRTCFVQNYFDHDPGPGRRDYACGSMTYDGHDGIDIRLPSLSEMRTGVDVLAAAAGVVEAARDGAPDVSTAKAGPGAVEGRECGNGVLLAHPGGWQTQYCHLRRGSIAVRVGRSVASGQRLGQIGLSGQTEFPHLHLSVRQNGTEVDPFAYGNRPNACRSGRMLWAPRLRASLAYGSPTVIAAGFADGPVTAERLDEGAAARPLSTRSAAIVAFVRTIGLEAGDIQMLRLIGPSGNVLKSQELSPLERAKASYFLFTGSAAMAGRWPSGTYTAEYSVRRKGAPAMRRRWSVKLQR